MTAWQAGMRITAARLLDYTPETVASGATASAGFSLTTFSGRRAAGWVSVYLLVNRTGADITATGGNIGDTAMCTLPAGWRPLDEINAQYGNGSMDGEAIIATNGLVTLRSANATITSGTNLRLAAAFPTG